MSFALWPVSQRVLMAFCHSYMLVLAMAIFAVGLGEARFFEAEVYSEPLRQESETPPQIELGFGIYVYAAIVLGPLIAAFFCPALGGVLIILELLGLGYILALGVGLGRYPMQHIDFLPALPFIVLLLFPICVSFFVIRTYARWLWPHLLALVHQG